MSIKGVIISNGAIGANTVNEKDSISGLIASGVAADSLALGAVATIFTLKDAEDLGIDAAYDVENNCRVHRHISEFYRMAGEGVKLYIMLVAQSVTMTEMVEDATAIYAKQLITQANGEIRQLAVSINPEPTYTSVLLNGMDSDVYNAIPKAQLLYEWADASFRPCNIVLEGREFNGSAASAADLRAIAGVAADHVSVVIGQGWAYAETQNSVGKKFADVGTALGSIAKLPVHRNIGEVETMDISDTARGVWLTPGLSSHVKIIDSEAQLETLDEKGYIFGITYTGISGVFWNGDHTCVAIIKDNEGNINEHTIAYGRVMNKAKRLLRTKLLPKVKTTYPLDPSTGKLPIGVIKYLEGIGDEAFEEMQESGNISEGKSSVNADSNLSVIPRILKCSFKLVPKGTIDEIEGTINLKTNL